MARLSIYLLGSFQVTRDGDPATGFRYNKVRALLAYLAVEADRPHTREALAGLLWPDLPDRAAGGNLRNALSRLRKAIDDARAAPPHLLVTHENVQFNRESSYWLDVETFGSAIGSTQAHGHRSLETCTPCMQRLAQAAEAYRGEFLAGFSLDSVPYEEWLVVQREQLHHQALDAFGHLAAYHERRGEYKPAIRYAQRQVELEPWRESAHRQWMRSLALNGQRAEALVRYEACWRVLDDELGVEPEEETTSLYERIRDGASLVPVAPARPHNLPAQLTPFIGRRAVLAEIAGRLADPACRLLTLVGPGGSGKTRLALEAAAQHVDRYEHGVFYASLAPLQRVEAIVPTIARSIGFSLPGGGDPRQQLLSYLRQKEMLLILDNFEHLLSPPAVGPPNGKDERTGAGATFPPSGGDRGGENLVTDILRAAGDVQILATSRARLSVGGEHLFFVGGMDYPRAKGGTGGSQDLEGRSGKDVSAYSAVQLFVSSARRIVRDFEPSAEDLSHVVRICRLVRGMPLAILLAAAWVQVLSLAEIAAEIEQSMDFLEAELRDLPERQRSMRAVYNHSWRLLTERERAVCAELSVFLGGFTREAAEQVAGATLRDLMSLVNRSLLHRTPTGRYEIHELLRQYAAEQLERRPGTGVTSRDRHAAYFAAALELWEADLKSARDLVTLAEMDVEIDNARAAWDHAAERGDLWQLDRAMDGLCWYYSLRRRAQEGRTACQAAVSRLTDRACGDGLRVLARCTAWYGTFEDFLGNQERAYRLAEQSLAMLEDPALENLDTRQEKAWALLRMTLPIVVSDPARAEQLGERSLAAYRSLGDRWGMAQAVGVRGMSAVWTGNYAQAEPRLRVSLALWQEVGNHRYIAYAQWGLGLVVLYQGRYEEAESLAQECIAYALRTGDRSMLKSGNVLAIEVRFMRGEFARAHALAQENMALCNELATIEMVNLTVRRLIGAKVELGLYAEARASVRAALVQYRGLEWFNVSELDHLLSQLALVEGAYAEAYQRAQEAADAFREQRSRPELIQALALCGYAAHRLDQVEVAERYLGEALQTAAEIRALVPSTLALSVAALLLADRGDAARAVELYAFASRHPFVANSRWFADVVGRHVAAVAESLPPEVAIAAEERGQARDLWATVGELLAELDESKERRRP